MSNKLMDDIIELFQSDNRFLSTITVCATTVERRYHHIQYMTVTVMKPTLPVVALSENATAF